METSERAVIESRNVLRPTKIGNAGRIYQFSSIGGILRLKPDENRALLIGDHNMINEGVTAIIAERRPGIATRTTVATLKPTSHGLCIRPLTATNRASVD